MLIFLNYKINFKSQLAEVPVDTTTKLTINGFTLNPTDRPQHLIDYDLSTQDTCDLATTIEKCRDLRVLVIKNLKFSEEGLTALAIAIEKSRTLQELRLTHSHISCRGVTELAITVERINSLKTLDLSGNDIDDIGAIVLAAAIEKSSSLLELNLSNNNIRDIGTEALVAAIEKSRNICELDLSYNSISDTGAIALASAIEKSCSLESVNLFENYVTDIVAKNIVAALEKSQTLKFLDLGGNANAIPIQYARIIAAITWRQPRLSVYTYIDRSAWEEKEPDLKEEVVGILFDTIAGINTQVKEPLLIFSTAATTRARSCPARKLLSNDGDHAIMWRVAKFLNGVQYTDKREPALLEQALAEYPKPKLA